MTVVELRLDGQLTVASLAAALKAIQPSIDAAPDRVGLLVNCLEMTGYELAARSEFVEWIRRNNRIVRDVAIVTTNRLWHMVVSAMALASGGTMKACDSIQRATVWLTR
jgi:hypothetical protein